MDNNEYLKYRGKCKEISEAYIKKHPHCKLVKGWYNCPFWGPQEHYWIKDDKENIIDLTKNQFPSKGIGEYKEYDGYMPCEYCGKETKEENIYFVEHHTYCSSDCYVKDVGL